MIRIWAGHAISAERFVVSAGELNDEQPRSVTLSYNARHEMTWGYAELQRTIKSITALPDGGKGKPLFLALSNEGEVFHLTGSIPIEKIGGAGVWSDDAEGWGSTVHIALCDGRLYVCGYGSQVYERIAEGDWRRICDRDRPNVADSAFFGLTCRPGQGLIAVCGQKRVKYRTPSAEDQARIDRARAAGDEAGAKALEAQARTIEVPKSSCLYFRDGAGWREAETGFDGGLNACQVLGDGAVLAVGDHGVMIRAEGPDGVEDLSQPGLTENLYTIGLWNSEVTVLGQGGIHVFGPDLSFRRTIALPDGLSLPNRHQVVGEDLFYIDYGGLALYRNEAWQRIVIPDDMWTFAGG
jgi:hypothetical protein